MTTYISRTGKDTEIKPFDHRNKDEATCVAGAGMSFKRYPAFCDKCKKGKVSQASGICNYVMCRFQNKPTF